MTTKPEFTKPFNIEHAKAGAPYGCSNGGAAKINKWDGRGSFGPLVGFHGEFDVPVGWSKAGEHRGQRGNIHTFNLVMLPLGLIDGKPVFVGDKITSPDCKGNTTALHNMNFGEGSTWTWPAPAPAYPKTLIYNSNLFDEYSKVLRSLGYTAVSAESHGLAAVANFAIRHAIDAGQVVLPGADRDAKRDLVVAQAVAKAVHESAYVNGRHSPRELQELLEEVIAGVAK